MPDTSAPYLVQVSIYWDPLDLITWLQTLLQDTYRDAGDGRTPVREIVQNADDAKAKRLVFAALDEGASSSCNTLLSGPALLVANDGPFSDQDKTALHKAIGGSKTGDAEKIGRFGIGLKSVFHLCEAFVYLGAEGSTTKPGVLNPWVGTGADRDCDPLHLDWDTVHDRDQRILLDAAQAVLGSFDNGLLLWIPLRLREHFNRAPNGAEFGLVTNYPTIKEVAGWFDQPASLALLLAQCGHLDSIKAVRAENLGQLDNPKRLVHFARPGFKSQTWVGRHGSNSGKPNGPFQGRIEDDGGAGWSVTGVDALGLDSLSNLTSAPDWPRDHYSQGGVISLVPRKALAHAAITVLHRQHNGLAGVRIRWAVFLPLDDGPPEQNNSDIIVDTVSTGTGEDSWDIIMHGYFWPSQDRRSIPGATNNDNGGAGRETRMRACWNRKLRDELLLPLLPQALARAAQQVPDAAWKLVGDVASSNTVHIHRASVTRSHALLPVITAAGVEWRAVAASDSVLEIPAWMGAPHEVRNTFVQEANQETLIVIAKDAPRIGGEPGLWPVPHITLLLNCVTRDTLRTLEGLDWTAKFVGYVLGQHGADNGRSGAVARWLADMLANGALTAASDLRSAWERLSAKLPDWVIYTPVESRDAVVELATAGVLGDGLLPIPIGRRTRNDPLRDQDKLDTALRVLGEGNDTNTQRSRLLLAEDLLSLRDGNLTDDLARLPLLRAHRFPDDQDDEDDAWSVNDMRRAIERHRVFSRNDDQARQAVISIADALGEACWLVGPVPASLAEVPGATTGALADAVLAANTISSNPAQRIPLLLRLAEDYDDRTGRALRVLLTGEPAAAEGARNLYYVRDDDGERDLNRTTLEILLRLRAEEWREVPPDLVAPLRIDLVNSLRVNAADTPGVLQDLLGETLTTDAGWDQLRRDEVIHLLKRLHGMTPEDRQRWRDMPLHRDVDGNRGPIDDRALVAGELDLPDELRNENIRLLNPDPELINLYGDIQSLNREGILCTMLRDERPYGFANYILNDLAGQETLPDNTELLELLKRSPWLPTCDDSGLAPAQLIDLPGNLLNIVQPLATALGQYRLPEAVIPEIWDRANRIVHEVLGRPNRRQQLQSFARALDPTNVAEVDGGAFLILPLDDQVDDNLIQASLETSLADSHRGWKIVRAAAAIIGRIDNAVVEIACALRGPVPAPYQRAVLTALANTSRDSPSGRLYRRLVTAFVNMNTMDFFEHVLPSIAVPTQDGNWRSPGEVARSPFGVDRRHRIVEELRPVLRLDTDTRTAGAPPRETAIRGGGTSDSVLGPYFQRWKDRLHHSAVGAFLSLLGDGHDGRTLELAQRWLGDMLEVGYVRRLLPSSDRGPRCGQVRVFVSGSDAGDSVDAVNLLGQTRTMHADSGNETIFAKEPYLETSVRGAFWIIRLRDVTPERCTERDLVAYLQNTVEWWAARVLRMEVHDVRRWWKHWWTGEQGEVAPVRALILADLPLTLQHLGVHDRPPLQEALVIAKQTRLKRVQAEVTEATEPAEAQQARRTEKAALKRLGELITVPEHSAFLRERVRETMERSGYTAESVLLELMQNADDALAQAAEIGGPLPQAACRAIIRVIRVDGTSTIDFIHYGRPINYTGGALFPAGKERQWDQDLYYMMLLNLTAKPGEAQNAAGPSTTGRFGLGFKSVHLISDSPSVVSEFAFAISAGLLPVAQPIPNDPVEPIGDHRATRIRLPLRTEADLIARIFHRFHPILPLLPAFARELRKIVVKGGPYAGVGVFDDAPIAETGWSINRETTELPGHGTWRLLRFRPGLGTAALVVGLRDGVPAPLPPEVPFLWNVAPTDEWRGCGYAVNGPFKLDPGRTHVSLGHQGTLLVVKQLGTALGTGLVSLHDALSDNNDSMYDLPVGCDEVAHFTAALWKVLASGIDDRDKLRCGFLRQLHGSRRGISAWMCARPVVPTELLAPFRDRLAPLDANTPIERAEGGLDTAHLCDAIAGLHDMVSLVQDRPAVSGSIAHVLQSLGMRWSRLQPSDLFKMLAERWENLLTPEQLHALRPLAQDTVWELVADPPRREWYSNFVAYSVAGNEVSLDNLLLPPELNDDYVDSSAEEELRRAKFAPETAVLSEGYIRGPEDVTIFRRLRTRHNVNADTIAAWFTDLDAERQKWALRYLLHGDLQEALLQNFATQKPTWLTNYNYVQSILNTLGAAPWQCKRLLAALFPEIFPENLDQIGAIDIPDEPGDVDAHTHFFDNFQDWWNDDTVRNEVIGKYERNAWPNWLRAGDGIADGLRGGSRDHWLALLVLGSCRGLGRARDFQHRSFLELAYTDGWWGVFMEPGSTNAWMNMLRTWQDEAVNELKYAIWMSLFPTIYQCSRYLCTYRRLLLGAGQREGLDNIKVLLAPRADPDLTGSGARFNAPPAPLDMGLHWVLRELVRLGIIQGDHLLPDCWVPSRQVLNFLERFGYETPTGSSNSEKARSVFAFMAEKMNTNNPHLHYSFDIPLRHVASDENLQREIGLAT